MRPLVRWLVAASVTVASLAACSGDDDDDAAPSDTTPPSVTTSQAPDAGDIAVPELPGTFPVAIPSIGFGIALPEGWQATVLSDDALERLADAALATPFFLDAARTVAESGAIFYAAGVDDDGRVAELKVDVQDGADTSPDAVRSLAQAVVDGGAVREGVVVDGGDDARLRVDFRLEQPSADDGELIDAYGSQYFVVDGDRLWSIIVTSEDEATQAALLAVFEATLTFD